MFEKCFNYLLSVLLLLGLGSCATKKPLAPPLPAGSAADFFAEWQTTPPPQTGAWRASGKIRLEQAGKVVYADINCLFDGNDRAYLELSGFTFPGFILATSKGRVEMFEVKDQTLHYRYAKEGADLGFSVLGLSFTISGLQRSLQARTLLKPTKYLLAGKSIETGSFLLKGTTADGALAEAQLVPAWKTLTHERWRKASTKKTSFAAEYGKFTRVGPRLLPRRLAWQLPAKRVVVRISWKKLEWLETIDADLFEISLPQGITRRELE